MTARHALGHDAALDYARGCAVMADALRRPPAQPATLDYCGRCGIRADIHGDFLERDIAGCPKKADAVLKLLGIGDPDE